jgi:HK97 family phage major capsid protein
MLKPLHSWNTIRAKLLGSNVRVFAKVASAQGLVELDKEIAGLLAEANAITNLAEKEKRDLTDEDVERLSAIMDEDTGEVAKLQAERDRAAKIIALKKAAARGMDDLRRNRYSGLVSEDEEEDDEDDDNPFAEDEDDEPHDEDEDDEPKARRRSRRRKNSRRPVIRLTNRLKNFKGPNAACDAFAAGMFIKARVAQKRGLRDEKAEKFLASRGFRATHTEGTPADGGYLVPEVLERAIIDVRDKHSVLRPLITVKTMTSLKHLYNKRTGGLTVYYVDEEEGYTESKKGWGRFELSAVKRGVLTKITTELQEDSIINVVDDVVSEFGLAFGLNEDREIVNGAGDATAGGVTGLVPALGTAGKIVPANGGGFSTWAGLTMAHFTQVLARLPDRFDGFEQTWLCSRTFYYQVMLPLLVAAGGNTIATLEAGAAGGPTFLGYRAVFTEQMPKATAVSQVCCLFGAFAQAVVLGQRTGVEIGQSEQFAFDEDVLTIKARTRYDIKVHEPGTVSVVGAYVGLQTAAS